LQSGDRIREAIRAQVMRAMALNRDGGYHFAGNFIDISYDRFDRAGTQLSFESGPQVLDPDACINMAAVGLLADLTLAATVRTALDSEIRLATVNLQLSFTGAPFLGRLETQGRLDGRVEGVASETWLARLDLNAGGRPAAFARGSFIVLPPPRGITLAPLTLRGGKRVPTPALATPLTRIERGILKRADVALAAIAAEGGSFIQRFWYGVPRATVGGAACAVKNGPHIANRVGHVQGGLLAGLALMTASAALPRSWTVSDASVSYISPGEGRVIRLKSKIIHHGRSISVLRTQATGKGGRLVMDVVSTHAFRAHS